MKNFSYAGYRNAKIKGQPIHADAQWLQEILAKNLAGVNRGESL
jgi:hypothetical protein